MQKLKTGAEIQTYGEITNLIIQIINCSKEFREDYVTISTIHHLQGCPLEITKNQIGLMVYDILQLMQKHNFIVISNGVYIKKSNYSLEDYYAHKHSESIIL